MRLLIRVVIFLGVLVVALVAIGFMLPKTSHIERNIVIAAPQATVFGLVDSFRDFDKWSPWAEKDPAMKVTRSGPESGVGAKYSWTGNSEVGSGSQEIVGSTPDSQVRINLKFDGFDGDSVATMTITPEGSGSRVVWALDSQLGGNPVDRYFGLMMDKMVGPDYVEGLARLKKLAESQPKADVAVPQPEPVSVEPAK